MDLIDLMG
jgi:hypothetical protein